MKKKNKPTERVTIISGNEPILLTCPHGFDDTHTNILVESAATELNCSALINHGWRRSQKVDEVASEANCNNMLHIMDKNYMAVNDEYGAPFVRLVNKIERRLLPGNGMLILHVHGVGNWIKKNATDNIHAIIGYGAGKKPSYSCQPWMATAFANLLTGRGINTYLGVKDGKYSARMKSNVNQCYAGYDHIQSMQIELTNDLRDDEVKAKQTGRILAASIKDFIEGCSSQNYPKTTVPEI